MAPSQMALCQMTKSDSSNPDGSKSDGSKPGGFGPEGYEPDDSKSPGSKPHISEHMPLSHLPRKAKAFTWYCFNVGPTSAMLAQNWNSIRCHVYKHTVSIPRQIWECYYTLSGCYCSLLARSGRSVRTNLKPTQTDRLLTGPSFVYDGWQCITVRYLTLRTLMSTTVDILGFYWHLYNQLLKVKCAFNFETLIYIGT